ncbi:unnamed protein product [Lepidochelys kempii]
MPVLVLYVFSCFMMSLYLPSKSLPLFELEGDSLTVPTFDSPATPQILHLSKLLSPRQHWKHLENYKVLIMLCTYRDPTDFFNNVDELPTFQVSTIIPIL